MLVGFVIPTSSFEQSAASKKSKVLVACFRVLCPDRQYEAFVKTQVQTGMVRHYPRYQNKPPFSANGDAQTGVCFGTIPL